MPQSFSHRLMAQEPIRTKSGSVRIADSKNFPASVTIAAALVEILPGGMRELHASEHGRMAVNRRPPRRLGTHPDIFPPQEVAKTRAAAGFLAICPGVS